MCNLLTAMSSARARATAAMGRRLGLAQISVAAVLWGTTGIVVRRLQQSTGLGPVAIGFYRLLAAALLLLLVTGPKLRRAVRDLRASPWALIAAGVGLAVYQALYFTSVADVGVSVSTVVSLGIAPIATTVLESVRARQKPNWRTTAVVSAAVTGLALVAISTSGAATAAAPRPAIGLLAAVGSGLGYAFTTVVSRHAAQTVSPLTMITTSSVIGAFTLLPLALAAGIDFTVTPGATTQLLYLGAATTVLAYALFYAGLQTASSSAASILTLLEPLTATALAVLVLAEPLPALTIAGGALLLGAIVLVYATPAARTVGS